MRLLKLKNYTRGWVIGDFEPNVVRTKAFEFGVKRYTRGEREPAHFHKIATEISVIVSGEFEMNGKKLVAGDIVVTEPRDIARFRCSKRGATAVIKIPSVKGDKYSIGDTIAKHEK